MSKDKQEVCMITITMPVNDDDQAISMKKKISEVLSDIPDARFEFRLMEMKSRHV